MSETEIVLDYTPIYPKTEKECTDYYIPNINNLKFNIAEDNISEDKVLTFIILQLGCGIYNRVLSDSEIIDIKKDLSTIIDLKVNIIIEYLINKDDLNEEDQKNADSVRISRAFYNVLKREPTEEEIIYYNHEFYEDPNINDIPLVDTEYSFDNKPSNYSAEAVWGGILAEYHIGGGKYEYKLKIVEPGTYSIELQADNWGWFYLDGELLMSTPHWGKSKTVTYDFDVGIFNMKIVGVNEKGAHGVAVVIYDPSGKMISNSRVGMVEPFYIMPPKIDNILVSLETVIANDFISNINADLWLNTDSTEIVCQPEIGLFDANCFEDLPIIIKKIVPGYLLIENTWFLYPLSEDEQLWDKYEYKTFENFTTDLGFVLDPKKFIKLVANNCNTEDLFYTIGGTNITNNYECDEEQLYAKCLEAVKKLRPIESDYQTTEDYVLNLQNYLNTFEQQVTKCTEDNENCIKTEEEIIEGELISTASLEGIGINIDPSNDKYNPTDLELSSIDDIKEPAEPLFSLIKPDIEDYSTWQKTPPVDRTLPTSPVLFPDILKDGKLYDSCELSYQPDMNLDYNYLFLGSGISGPFDKNSANIFRDEMEVFDDKLDAIDDKYGSLNLFDFNLSTESVNTGVGLLNIAIKKYLTVREKYETNIAEINDFLDNGIIEIGLENELDLEILDQELPSISDIDNEKFNNNFSSSTPSGLNSMEAIGYRPHTMVKLKGPTEPLAALISRNNETFNKGDSFTYKWIINDCETIIGISKNSAFNVANMVISNPTYYTTNKDKYEDDRDSYEERAEGYYKYLVAKADLDFVTLLKDIKKRYEEKVVKQKRDYPNAYTEDTTDGNGLYRVVSPDYYTDLENYKQELINYNNSKIQYQKDLAIYNVYLNKIEYSNNIIKDKNRIADEIGEKILEIDEKRLNENLKTLLSNIKKQNYIAGIKKPSKTFYNNSIRNDLMTQNLSKQYLDGQKNKTECLSAIISHTIKESYIPKVITVSTLEDFNTKLKDQIAHKYFLNNYIDELDTNNTFTLNNLNRLTSGIVNNPMYIYHPMKSNPDLNPDLVFEELQIWGMSTIELENIIKSNWEYPNQEKPNEVIENNKKTQELHADILLSANESKVRYNDFKNNIIETLKEFRNSLKTTNINLSLYNQMFLLDTENSKIEHEELINLIELVNTKINIDQTTLVKLYGEYRINYTLERAIYLKIFDNNFISTITTFDNYDIGCRVLIPLFKYLIDLINLGQTEIINKILDLKETADITYEEINKNIATQRIKNVTKIYLLENELIQLSKEALDEDIETIIQENLIIPNFCNIELGDANDNFICIIDPDYNKITEIDIPCLEPKSGTYEIVRQDNINESIYSFGFNLKFGINQGTVRLPFDTQKEIMITPDLVTIKISKTETLKIPTYNVYNENNPINISVVNNFNKIQVIVNYNGVEVKSSLHSISKSIIPKYIEFLDDFCGTCDNFLLLDLIDKNPTDKLTKYDPNGEVIYYPTIPGTDIEPGIPTPGNTDNDDNDDNININGKVEDGENGDNYNGEEIFPPVPLSPEYPVDNLGIPLGSNDQTLLNIDILKGGNINKVYSYKNNFPATILNKNGLGNFFCRNNINQKNNTICFWFRPTFNRLSINRTRLMLVSDDVYKNYIYYNDITKQIIFDFGAANIKTYKVFDLIENNDYINFLISTDYINDEITIKLRRPNGKYIFQKSLYFKDYNFNLMSILTEYDYSQKRHVNDFRGKLKHFSVYFKEVDKIPDIDKKLDTQTQTIYSI